MIFDNYIISLVAQFICAFSHGCSILRHMGYGKQGWLFFALSRRNIKSQILMSHSHQFFFATGRKFLADKLLFIILYFFLGKPFHFIGGKEELTSKVASHLVLKGTAFYCSFVLHYVPQKNFKLCCRRYKFSHYLSYLLFC